MAPPVLMLRFDRSDPPGPLADWLRDGGVDFELCALDEGDPLPEDLAGYSGLVALGGGMGANDDATVPFLPGVRALLRAAVRDEVPVLAICLGAQLLAAANGGRVRVDPDGPELGAQLIAKRSAAADDPLFAPMPITPDVVQWHFDTISALPPGAVLLAGSPACENQAFRLGRMAWGIQFHIETTPDVVRAWAAEDAAALADYDLDAIVARAVAVHDDVAEVWAPFVGRFAAVCLDPSSVPAAAPAADPNDPAAIRARLAAEAASARAPLGMPTLGMPTLGMPTMRPPWDE